MGGIALVDEPRRLKAGRKMEVRKKSVLVELGAQDSAFEPNRHKHNQYQYSNT